MDFPGSHIFVKEITFILKIIFLFNVGGSI